MLPRHLLLLCLAWPALANTEIVNFSAARLCTLDPKGEEHLEWPWLNASIPTQQFLTIKPAPILEGTTWKEAFPIDESPGIRPHELWAVLDIDSFPISIWREFYMYTLRLSWPAWSPVDFDLQIFDNVDLGALTNERLSLTGRTTRRRYARIRAKNAGVHRNETFEQGEVGFHLILEKLELGFLPSSVKPILFFILLSLWPSYYAARYILRLLAPIIQRSNDELRDTTTAHKDD